MSEINKSSELVSFNKKIDSLEKKIELIKQKVTPDNLAKSIDNSYLSIHNIRVFLQILALIITIFLAGAVGFGIFGISNIFSVHDNAEKVEDMKEIVQTYLESVSSMEKKIQISSNNIDSTLSIALMKVSETENDLRKKITNLNNNFNKAISDVHIKSDEEIKNLESRIQDKILQTNTDIKALRNELRSISEIFNKIGIIHEDKLNAREKQLLTLIAMEIDPNNPFFNFNYATWAMSFGRYKEALESLEKVLKTKALPDDVINRAQKMKQNCIGLIQNPPKVEHHDPQGVAIGDYVIMQLHVNTIDALFRNGYLSYEQAQNIFDKAKLKK